MEIESKVSIAALLKIEWLETFAYVGVGFLICWALIPLVLTWSVKGRKATRCDFHHPRDHAVVRLGGGALVASFFVVAMAIANFTSLSPPSMGILRVLVLGSLAMYCLGLRDDLRPLGSRFKFVMQILIATGVYLGGIKVEILKDPVTGLEFSLGIFSYLLTVLWLVTLTNLINLIDGIDGLAGGICLMLMCLLANLGAGGDAGFTVLLPMGVAGALLGFLRFNYPPAKIHMGDGGAYFLGFLIGTLSIVNSNKGTIVAALVAPAFALALPIADVSIAVCRRAWRGLPLFRPDQKHIHHRLIKLGFSRERAVWLLYSVSLLCLGLAFAVFWGQGRFLPLLTGLLFLVLLMAGYFSGCIKNGPSLRVQVREALALRKETRHALVLCRWLEMEAERHRSVGELWQDYHFAMEKLRFSRVKLVLPTGAQIWESEGFDAASPRLQHACHELSDGSSIEFSSDSGVLPERVFLLLADLSAEIWHKAIAILRPVERSPEKERASAPVGLSGAMRAIRLEPGTPT